MKNKLSNFLLNTLFLMFRIMSLKIIIFTICLYYIKGNVLHKPLNIHPTFVLEKAKKILENQKRNYDKYYLENLEIILVERLIKNNELICYEKNFENNKIIINAGCLYKKPNIFNDIMKEYIRYFNIKNNWEDWAQHPNWSDSWI